MASTAQVEREARAKQSLLDNLKHHTLCRIKPSGKHGVGVFAIKDIPAGQDPFKTARPVQEHVVTLNERDVRNLDRPVRRMLHDFCHTKGDYDVPAGGLNTLDVSFYLNHSSRPNLDIVLGRSKYLEFRANRVIKAGEELLIDYKKYE